MAQCSFLLLIRTTIAKAIIGLLQNMKRKIVIRRLRCIVIVGV